jgi:Na+/proline symporter
VLKALNRSQDSLNAAAKLHAIQLSNASKGGVAEKVAEAELNLKQVVQAKERLRSEAKNLVKATDRAADTNDTNYIFLYFVLHHLPKGLVGLLIAVIFLSAWGSIAAALNSLSSSTVIDLYKRIWVTKQSDTHYYRASKWITLFWGIFCIATAMFASQLGSLIEAVNILGSLFYGTMLGIFVVAFYIKKVESVAVFYAAIVAELAVIIIYSADWVSFLWLNVIGCLLVMLIASVLQYLGKKTVSTQTNA